MSICWQAFSFKTVSFYRMKITSPFLNNTSLKYKTNKLHDIGIHFKSVGILITNITALN